MLEIKGLYKAQDHTKINNIDLIIIPGGVASIECGIEMSDLLINLILGKEIPARGEVLIDNQSNHDFFKKHRVNTGVILVAEGFYERLTVDAYLQFYSELLSSSIRYKDVMMKLGTAFAFANM